MTAVKVDRKVPVATGVATLARDHAYVANPPHSKISIPIHCFTSSTRMIMSRLWSARPTEHHGVCLVQMPYDSVMVDPWHILDQRIFPSVQCFTPCIDQLYIGGR